jgi:hypothetical protein
MKIRRKKQCDVLLFFNCLVSYAKRSTPNTKPFSPSAELRTLNSELHICGYSLSPQGIGKGRKKDVRRKATENRWKKTNGEEKEDYDLVGV